MAVHHKINNKGSALIGVMIAAGMVAVLGLAVQEIAKANLRTVKIARIRAFISTAELQLRSQLSHPASFEGCTDAVGASSCRLRTSILSKYRLLPVPGTACSTVASGCGLVLMRSHGGNPMTIDFTQPYAHGTVNSPREAMDFAFYFRYSGSDVSIKDTPVIASVPFDLLQEARLDCGRLDPSRPLFAGYDTSGRVRCRALEPDCPPGQFLNEVNANTLERTCNLIRTLEVQCDLSQFVASFNWNSGNTFTSHCEPRRNPFMVFPFSSTPVPPPLPPPLPTPVPPPPVSPPPVSPPIATPVPVPLPEIPVPVPVPEVSAPATPPVAASPTPGPPPVAPPSGCNAQDGVLAGAGLGGILYKVKAAPHAFSATLNMMPPWVWYSDEQVGAVGALYAPQGDGQGVNVHCRGRALATCNNGVWSIIPSSTPGLVPLCGSSGTGGDVE